MKYNNYMREIMKFISLLSILMVIIIAGCSVNKVYDFEYIALIAPDELHRAPIDFVFEVCDSNSLNFAVISYNTSNDDSTWTNSFDLENITDTITIHYDNNSFLDGSLKISLFNQDSIQICSEEFEFEDSLAPTVNQLQPIEYIYFPPCTLSFEVYDDFELQLVNYVNDSFFYNYYYNNEFIDTIIFIIDSFSDLYPHQFIAYDNSGNRTEIEYQCGPKYLASFETNSCTKGNFIVQEDYFCSAELNYGVTFYDIVQQNTISKINYENIYIYYINIKDNYLFAADSLYDLVIYDIKDISNPQYINSLYLTDGWVTDITFYENYVFIANSMGEICVYDLSYLPQLYEVASFSPNLFKAIPLTYIKDNILYITDGYMLYIYDISTLPANPSLINSITLENMIQDLLVFRDNLILSSKNCSYIYKLYNGISPELSDTICTHNLSYNTSSRTSVLTAADDYILISRGTTSVIFNIINNKVENRSVVSSYSVNSNSVEIFGDTLYFKGYNELWLYECQ